MHVVFLFPHTHTVDSFVCGVSVDSLAVFIASRASNIVHICTQRPINGWNFHVFLANATTSPYLNEIPPLSLLFCSPIFTFINSVTRSVIYCSCSSLGMRSINGLTASMVSDIKKHKHISKQISYHIACLMTVPIHSYVAGCVTE